MGCIYSVDEGSIALVNTCGKYSHTQDPGCGLLIPFFQNINYYSLKKLQYVVHIDTKTRDNVFCKIDIAIFYSLKRNQIVNYAYNIQSPKEMMSSVVQNSIRSLLTNYTLDEVFNVKDEISEHIKNALVNNMSQYGILFDQVLINDIEPEKGVKEAMNQIQTEERLRQAKIYKAEALKIEIIAKAEAEYEAKIKQAEAESQVKKLIGKGIADQRKEIAFGFGQSIEEINKLYPKMNEKEIMNIVQKNLYLDTLKHIGENSKSNLVFVPINHDINDFNDKIFEPSLFNHLNDKNNKND